MTEIISNPPLFWGRKVVLRTRRIEHLRLERLLRRGGAARSVSRAPRPRRLSRVDNKHCSACHASVHATCCGQCDSYGCGAARAHSRHPAAQSPAISLMPTSQHGCGDRRREAEKWRVLHESPSGRLQGLGARAPRLARRGGVAREHFRGSDGILTPVRTGERSARASKFCRGRPRNAVRASAASQRPLMDSVARHAAVRRLKPTCDF